MNLKVFTTIFLSVFLAELGDKTQIATLLFASEKDIRKSTVFIASSLALVITTAIGVVLGSFLSGFLNIKYLKYVAGIGFIGVGFWTIIKG